MICELLLGCCCGVTHFSDTANLAPSGPGGVGVYSPAGVGHAVFGLGDFFCVVPHGAADYSKSVFFTQAPILIFLCEINI